MLVLTRRTDESIVIDDRIVVTVLGIDGDKVKIGIAAPREVTILRQELVIAVKEQAALAEKLASGLNPDSFAGLRALLAEEEQRAEDQPG